MVNHFRIVTERCILRSLWARAALVLSLVLIGVLVATPVAVSAGNFQPPGEKRYTITEPGSLSYLGVDVEVRPELGPPIITGFWVSITYDDPVVSNDRPVQLLAPAFFPVSCHPEFRLAKQGPFTWHNKRGTGFAVTFDQHCKSVESGKQVPYLEFQIWSTDPAKEERHILVAREGRVFDIWPTGQPEIVKNQTHDVLEYAQTTYQIVSTISTVLDFVAFTRGGITAGRFVMRLIVGSSLDAIVNAGFEYAKAEYGYEVRFRHAGWQIRCRLCGEIFFRKTLSEGEFLECPRSTCEGAAHLHF